jgi:hydroxylaminobenzene mutase
MSADSSTLLVRQGRRLLQVGVALLLVTSFEGFAIPHFASPELGRSAHSLIAMLAILLLAMGLLWPKLILRPLAARVAFWCLLYSGLAIVVAFLMAAFWGAGQTTMPLAGASLGTVFQESAIKVVSYSTAPTGIIAFALIFWGLRMPAKADEYF